MKSNVARIEKKKADRVEAERLNRMIKEGLKLDYQKVFSSPEGVRVLTDILSDCHIFQTSFSLSGKDQTFFREGERNIGLILSEKMKRADRNTLLKAYSTNLKEAYTKETKK